jgi:phosphoribosylanthranilate isomerase
MTRIKICGVTSPDDALAAIDAGADALGFVFAESPRKVSLAVAEQIVAELPPLVSAVGVFVGAAVDEVATLAERVGLDAVQLHGHESPDDCQRLPCKVIKGFDILEGDTSDSLRKRMERYRAAAYLLRPGPGGGPTFYWDVAGTLSGRLIVSGGLSPDNVGVVIRRVRPFAVDVCSGVESEPGRKDPEKLRVFVEAVRQADDARNGG